jgi:putative transposase
MHFETDRYYHIFNQGNNQQAIFLKRDNYLYFLKKIKRYISPHCDILAWCLMPNHFHFLIKANINSVKTKSIAGIEKNVLSESFRSFLSSYTRAINKQENTSGSLFRQNTKAVQLGKDEFLTADNPSFYHDDIFTCFSYIHQNPFNARLVAKLEDWEFSSFRDYANLRAGTLINKKEAYNSMSIDAENYLEQAYLCLNEQSVTRIFGRIK